MVSLFVRMSYFSGEAVNYIKYPIVRIVLVPRVHWSDKVVLKRQCCVCLVVQVKSHNITLTPYPFRLDDSLEGC